MWVSSLWPQESPRCHEREDSQEKTAVWPVETRMQIPWPSGLGKGGNHAPCGSWGTDSYCCPSDDSFTPQHTHTALSSSFGHSHSWCYLCLGFHLFPKGLPPCQPFHLHHLFASEVCCVPAGAVLRSSLPSTHGHGEAGPMALLSRAASITHVTKHANFAGNHTFSWLLCLPSLLAQL